MQIYNVKTPSVSSSKSGKPVKESLMLTDGTNYKKSAYGTVSYMPATFVAVTASVAIRDLVKT